MTKNQLETTKKRLKNWKDWANKETKKQAEKSGEKKKSEKGKK